MKYKFIEKVNRFLKQNDSSCVSLDLGNAYVKGIYVQGTEIKNFFIEKNNGSPLTQASRWLKKEGLLSKETRIALKGQDTLVRYIPFPKVEKKKLKEIMGYEISQYIPFNRDEIYFDVALVNEHYSSREFFVLMALAKRDFLKSLIQECRKEKVNLSQISLHNSALINLFLNFGSSDKNVALVDIGVESTLLNLLKKDMPVLSREIKVSSNTLIQKLAAIKNVSLDDAEDMISKLDILNEKQKTAAIFEAVEEVGIEISEEVRNSLDYFEVNWGGPIDTLYLTGGFSTIKGIDKILKNSLGIETQVWDSLQYSKLSFDESISQYKEMLSVAVGLSL